MFSNEFLAHINDEIGLLNLVGKYTNLKKISEDSYIGCCPNPKHRDSNPSFSVYRKPGYKQFIWKCFGCYNHDFKSKGTKENPNYGNDCIAFYRWINNGLYFNKAVTDLCKEYNISIPQNIYDGVYKKNKDLATSFYVNLKSHYNAREYLYSRGLNDTDIKKWLIGYTHESIIEGNRYEDVVGYLNSNVSGKIVFPLFNKSNSVIGFSKRWIEKPKERGDKYRNSSESIVFNKSTYFYGMHNIDNSVDELRITEGTMDVIMADKYGAKNVVATLGTAFTDTHAMVIKTLNKTPVFIMDGDKAGRDSVESSIMKLANIGVSSKILTLEDDKDLCDISRREKNNIENYIQLNSINYSLHIINKTLCGYESNLLELKMKFSKEFEEILSKIPYDTERTILKNMINDKLRIY